MFLHYQPERTTSPDGDVWANQLLAIKALSVALPKDVTLVVKEHPSTFNRGSDFKHRWKAFYTDIISLGAELCDIRKNTYDIIDQADLVASIGGTVVGEALMRNKAAIILVSGLCIQFPVKRSTNIAITNPLKNLSTI